MDAPSKLFAALDLTEGASLLLWMAKEVTMGTPPTEMIFEAWERAGLPGKCPIDNGDGFDLGVIETLADAQPAWPDPGADPGAEVTTQRARWYGFSARSDMAAIREQAEAAGLEVVEFRRDLAVLGGEPAS